MRKCVSLCLVGALLVLAGSAQATCGAALVSPYAAPLVVAPQVVQSYTAPVQAFVAPQVVAPAYTQPVIAAPIVSSYTAPVVAADYGAASVVQPVVFRRQRVVAPVVVRQRVVAPVVAQPVIVKQRIVAPAVVGPRKIKIKG